MNELIVRPEIDRSPTSAARPWSSTRTNNRLCAAREEGAQDAGLIDGRDYALKPIGGTPQRLEAMEKSADNAAAMLTLHSRSPQKTEG